MKIALLLALVGLASCRPDSYDRDRDVEVKYKFDDDDFEDDKEYKVKYDDDRKTIFTKVKTPVVHAAPAPIQYVAQPVVARTSIIAVEAPRPAAVPVVQRAPVVRFETPTPVIQYKAAVPTNYVTVAKQPAVIQYAQPTATVYARQPVVPHTTYVKTVQRVVPVTGNRPVAATYSRSRFATQERPSVRYVDDDSGEK